MRRSVANNYNDHLHGYFYLLVCALKILLFKMLSLYIFTVVKLILGEVQISIYIYVIIFLLGACSVNIIYFVSTFWNDFYFFGTMINSNCWTFCQLKLFFRILEPSFLISRFPQKKIRQFKDEFIEVKVATQSNACTALSDVLSSFFKTFANIPKTTTVGR